MSLRWKLHGWFWAAIALALWPIGYACSDDAPPAGAGTVPPCDAVPVAAGAASPTFDDLAGRTQRFADELGRLKEQNRTTATAELVAGIEADRAYAFRSAVEPGPKADAETVYARVRPGVVVVGGIFKCKKCNRWHARCASGFVIGADGLIVTNRHVLEANRGLEALGVMTDDGRVMAIRSVLAVSRLDDLALLQVDGHGLKPLPLSTGASVGTTVYCVSHPSLAGGKGNGFYTLTTGIVSGKYTVRNAQREALNLLAVTAEYGPGSSGGSIVDSRGAVVGVVCQAQPVLEPEKDKDRGTMLTWRMARPVESLLAMLTPGGVKTPANASPANDASPPVRFALRPVDSAMVNYYRPMRIELKDEPPMKPKAEPKYAAAKVRYGAVTMGEPASRFLVALDNPAAGKPALYVDRNGDGDLTNDGTGDWSRIDDRTAFARRVIDVPYATDKVPSSLMFYWIKSRADSMFYYRGYSRQGEITLDGQKYRVLVLDDNSDGRFDDLAGGAWVIDLNQDGKLETEADSAEYYRLTEPVNVHGKTWQVASLSADGREITLRRASVEVAAKPYLNPGYPALNFEGRGLNDRPVTLKDEAAKTRYVLLDFWASWCGPCRAEFPTLRRIHARYKNQELTILGVNLDSDSKLAQDAASKAKLDYSHVFDGQGWKNAVAKLYRVHGIPQTYLIDSNLKIVNKNLRGPALEKRLLELLGPGDETAVRELEREEQKADVNTKSTSNKTKP